MTLNTQTVVVLYGGQSGEREISFKSALPTIKVLKNFYEVIAVQLDENCLPATLFPDMGLIFPLIHGDFGEDGQLQSMLEAGGFAYVGSDSRASALCMDKISAKNLAKLNQVSTLPCLELSVGQALCHTTVNAIVGDHCVLKPVDKGSSLGVSLCKNFGSLTERWSTVVEGRWMLETLVHGRELTVGLLNGRALGVVEIVPKKGFYDYENKYTAGACEYLFPAPLSDALTQSLQRAAETVFSAAGCCDFARADFILDDEGRFWFLEMNTIPGMTEHSLFPKSASCVGFTFEEVVRCIVDSAFKRNGGKCSVQPINLMRKFPVMAHG